MRPQLAFSLVAIVAAATLAVTTSSHADDPFGGGGNAKADPFGGANNADDPFGGGGKTADDPFAAAPRQVAAQQSARLAEEREREQAAEWPFSATQPVYWSTAKPEIDDQITRILNGPLTSAGLDFTDTPLAEVVEFVREEYNLPIQFDIPALNDLAISVDEPVSCNIRGVALGAALRLMLRQFGCELMIKDEFLMLTTQEFAECEMLQAAYPVSDFVEEDAVLQLAESIMATVAVDTWAANGGGEGTARCLGGGLLLVTQTRSEHDEIKRMLEALRRACNATERKITKAEQTVPSPANTPKKNQEASRGIGGGGQF
ncbi:MAG: hypothetical protein AAGJ46_09080 [Planctomycetota bacterium]